MIIKKTLSEIWLLKIIKTCPLKLLLSNNELEIWIKWVSVLIFRDHLNIIVCDKSFECVMCHC